MKIARKLIALTLALVLLAAPLCGCSLGGNYVKMHIQTADGSVDGYGYIELYPDIAPITVKNFKSLVQSGFYDGLTFHRLVKGFCLQGGDPEGTGRGGSGKPIKGEFAVNGVPNNLSHTTGVVSMARRGDSYDSATSQFFFVLSDNYTGSLDYQYAAFGKVVAGWDVVEACAKVETGYNDRPRTTITIVSAELVKSVAEAAE